MNAQDEMQALNINQQNIDRLNRRIQLGLLAEFKAYQWMDDWMPASVPEMPTPEDKHLQNEMSECLFGFPYALILTSKASNKRIWFSVYDDGQHLVQKVLSFASTSNTKFCEVVMDAYLDWIRNGRSSLWNPESFLQKISQYTYFQWSATPCFDMTDENGWPPAAREWADLYLQEILQPNDEVCFGAFPEFFVSPDAAASFSQMNITMMGPEYLEPRPFMREMRKGRFLSLGLPAVSFAQAVTEQMIPSLKRSVELPIPDKMVIWAQDLDERVCNEFDFGLRHGLRPSPDAPLPALQPIAYPPGVLQAAHDRLIAFFTLIASRNANSEAFQHNRAVYAQTAAMGSDANSS